MNVEHEDLINELNRLREENERLKDQKSTLIRLIKKEPKLLLRQTIRLCRNVSAC